MGGPAARVMAVWGLMRPLFEAVTPWPCGAVHAEVTYSTMVATRRWPAARAGSGGGALALLGWHEHDSRRWRPAA